MPRKYEVTLDTGQRYEVDWDGPDAPTAADVEAALPTVTSAQAEAAPSLFGRTMDIVGRVGNTLGRPGAVVAGAVKEGVEAYQQGQPLADLVGDIGRSTVKTLTPTGVGTFAQNPNFDQVLGQAGMQEGWGRAGLGFVGDVVADPLFFAKPAALAAKGLGKVASVVTDNSLVQRVTKPIKELISEPTFDHLVNQVPGTPTEGLAFGDMRRLGASRRRSAGEHAEAGAQTFFHEVTDPAKRAKLAHAIDQGVSTGDAQLDALIPKWRQKMDELWQTQLQLGLVEPDQYRKNYVQYVTRTGRPAEAVVSSATNALPASSFKREKFKTLADAVKAGGATDDLQEILAISTAQVEKAKRTDEFLREVKTVFGSGDAGPNMRKLNVNNIKVGKTLAKDLEGTYLPTEIADDLERAIVVWEKPTELDGIYKTGMKISKTLMTTVNPGHHATNLVGNVHNMYIAGGMTLPEITTGYVSAAKMARAAKQGKNALPSIGKYSSDELFKWANEYEILGSSSQLGESVVKGVGERIANNPAFTTARKIGTRYFEEPARLALYLDQVRKGKTPAEAAIKVKNVLFDYAELTPKEKTLRDSGLIPFYCVPTTYQALTREGWKSHDNLTTNDELYTLNAHTGHMEWAPVENVAVFDTPDYMVSMTSQRTGEWLMTPGHRWVVKDYIGRVDIVPVEVLNTGMKIVLNGVPAQDTESSLLTPPQAQLLGWLLTDGYWRFRGNHCEAVIYQHPHKFLEEVINVAGGQPRRPHPDTGVVCVPVLNERVKELKAVLQSGDFESIPSQLSTEARLAMYDAMYKADGTVSSLRNSDFFAATHEDVKMTFSTLAFLLGYCITPSERGVHVRKTQTKKVTTFEYGHVVPTTAQVWCPATKNETWVMRTDTGHIMVTGNSWMRKNIPLQIEAMVKNPRGVEIVGDLMDVPWNAQGERVDQTVIPEKAQRTGFAPSPLAGPADQLVMSRYNLPVMDVNRVTDPATLTDMLGPVFKAGLEFATGRNSYGGMIDKPTGLANPAPAASLLGLGLNPLLPDQLEGYITPTEVNGQPKQHDRLAWAMSTLIPTGVYGSTAKASQADEQGQPTNANRALAMRLLGMPPDVITGQDQQYEAKRRLDELKRQLTRKVLLDK